jgi:hypothetical protein
MTSRTSLLRRSVVLTSVLLLTALAACGKKGLPEECDLYLARYDCWLAKQGMQDRSKTIDTMRQTWTDASKTGPGRKAIVDACNKSQAEMESKFATAGCANAAPAVKEK